MCSPHLEKDIKKICDLISSHFYNVEHKQITRMVLYFKVDSQSTLWLQWASSIRIASGTERPLELSPKFTKPHDDSGEKTMQEVERLDEQITAISQVMASKNFRGTALDLGAVNTSQDLQLTGRSIARFEQFGRLREVANNSPLPKPSPVMPFDTNSEESEVVEQENPELIAAREELAEVLDDLLYQIYSHFLHQTDAPFCFTVPHKLSEIFPEDVVATLMSQLHAHKDEETENQYSIPSGNSLSKLQHEHSQFRELVLEEFEYQFEQKEYEKTIVQVPDLLKEKKNEDDDAQEVPSTTSSSEVKPISPKNFEPTPSLHEDDDNVLMAEEE